MLPVRQLAADLIAALDRCGRVVLAAPTGSGKSTQVPQMLTEAVEGQVVVLQPRRLAARLLARRVAGEMGVTLGAEVGYQTRHEQQCRPDTRILFLTEGLFLRKLADPAGLDGVGVVILDEFHERHLDGDTALALCRRAQATTSPRLKFVVMSATLDAQRVAEALDCPALTTQQRTHPVELIYRKERPDDRRMVWDTAARAVRRTLTESPDGDVLVFMPGVAEIERTIAACSTSLKGLDVDVVPLYGQLPADAQDRAVSPGPRRKVIVATNVAETSITIESVHHVVDSGLVLRQVFDPRRQFNMLAMQRISQASADQRSGRAGRVAPGTCRRLWSLHDQRSRAPEEEPEVRRLDLAAHVLLLLAMGIDDVEGLEWFEVPNPDRVAAALELLRLLGALDGNGITGAGRDMARLPMHPRLARMVVAGAQAGHLHAATLWAALLSERDLFLRDGESRFDSLRDEEFDSPVARCEAAVDAARSLRFHPGDCGRAGINGAAAGQVTRTQQLFLRLAQRLALSAGPKSLPMAACLLRGFPDQVAVRRQPGSPVFDMPGGRSAHLQEAGELTSVVVAAEIMEVGKGGGMTARIGLHVPLTTTVLEQALPERCRTRTVTRWDEEQLAVVWERQTIFDDLVVARATFEPTHKGEAAAILASRIAAGELSLRRWGDKEQAWLDRVRCVAEWFPERNLLTYGEEDLELVYQEICDGATRYSQVKDRPCLDVLMNVLSWADQQFVKKMAPERIKLMRGYGMRIVYRPGEAPRGRAKIQDFHGMTETPTVANGRVKVLLEILAPNFRPVQTTDDLGGFWERTYPEVKRQLSRRYPRHEWR